MSNQNSKAELLPELPTQEAIDSSQREKNRVKKYATRQASVMALMGAAKLSAFKKRGPDEWLSSSGIISDRKTSASAKNGEDIEEQATEKCKELPEDYHWENSLRFPYKG